MGITDGGMNIAYIFSMKMDFYFEGGDDRKTTQKNKKSFWWSESLHSRELMDLTLFFRE
jgi:hypothetical protein